KPLKKKSFERLNINQKESTYISIIQKRIQRKIMFVEKINTLTIKEIQDLQKSENPLRLFFDEKPNTEQLNLLNDLVLKIKNDTTLVLEIRDENWIDLNEFECISKSISKIEFHTFKANSLFENLDGIEHFKNLKGVGFSYCYSNKIDLGKLTACPKLEYLNLENSITKKHHQAINKLTNLKELNIKGLDISQIKKIPSLESLYVLGLKNTDDMDKKLPNLKTLSIHRSHTILNLDFLQGLTKIESITLDGLSKVEKIPNLENNKNLKGFSVMNFKSLKEVSKFNNELESLRLGLNIPSLYINDLTTITPNNLPKVKDICLKFDKSKENEKLLDVFRKSGVEIRY
ncbi:hypothetical protein, partial [Winogradskyella wichelsiae]|uniref:hypothetical protein n=1 Tax=Winogradskyella wichelsiae TaxID=2697007 RepID=UPI001C5352F3